MAAALRRPLRDAVAGRAAAVAPAATASPKCGLSTPTLAVHSEQTDRCRPLPPATTLAGMCSRLVRLLAFCLVAVRLLAFCLVAVRFLGAVTVVLLAGPAAPAVAALSAGAAVPMAAAAPHAGGPRAIPPGRRHQPPPATSYRWPLDGRPAVVRPFAPPAQRWLPGHRGVDLAAAGGAVVRATGPGVVRFSGRVAGRGVVSVDHAGGLRTTYEPVLPTVRAGQRVGAGDQLGALDTGHPGCPVTVCLHWGLRIGETYLDPLSLLGRGRVRLLPLEGSAVQVDRSATQQGGQPLRQPLVLLGAVVDLGRDAQQTTRLPGVDRDLGGQVVGDALAQRGSRRLVRGEAGGQRYDPHRQRVAATGGGQVTRLEAQCLADHLLPVGRQSRVVLADRADPERTQSEQSRRRRQPRRVVRRGVPLDVGREAGRLLP